MARRTTKQAPRRTKRPRKKIKINKKRLIICVVGIALAVELVVILLTSPYFAIKNVEVTGNSIIAEEDILGSITLEDQTNIFRVSKKAVEQELKRNPIVESARLYRKLPSSIKIKIAERSPDIILNVGGLLHEVDEKDVPFRTVKERKGDIPVITFKQTKKIILGERILLPEFIAARECLFLAEEKKIPQPIKITVDQNNDLCLNVRDEFEIKLGRPDELRKKIEIAVQVMEQIPEFKEGGRYIDVSCPEAAVYMPK